MPPTPTGDLAILLTTAAFAPLTDRAFLRIAGPDAPRWLNGMVTNNIQALQPGEGNYNFLLNAQGRIQGDATVYRDPANPNPVYILETDRTQIDTVHRLLEQFIIMDDVELTSLDHFRYGILLLGPKTQQILTSIDVPLLGNSHIEIGPLRITYADSTSEQITTPAPGSVPHLYLTATTESQLALVADELRAMQITEASPETLEQLRILEARPRYGTDIRNSETAKDLPQETAQTHALHFAKGCYLGQEIVERIRSRGQVHRQFTPFRLEGAPLPTTFPIPLIANGKPAGELTSATPLPTTEGPLWLALGYARREFLETHTPLTYPGGTAHPRTPGSLA